MYDLQLKILLAFIRNFMVLLIWKFIMSLLHLLLISKIYMTTKIYMKIDSTSFKSTVQKSSTDKLFEQSLGMTGEVPNSSDYHVLENRDSSSKIPRPSYSYLQFSFHAATMCQSSRIFFSPSYSRGSFSN